MLIIIFKFRWC